MSDQESYHAHRELPGGGTLAYRIDTDNDEIHDRLRSAIERAVGAVREQARIGGVGDPSDARFQEGSELIDCGSRFTVRDVRDEDGNIVYDVEFEDGKDMSILASEVELGIIDGTIQVVPA